MSSAARWTPPRTPANGYPVKQRTHADRRVQEMSAPARVESYPERNLDPELSLYRSRTLGLLSRYLQLSSAVGRLPSLVGRECFRARVTSYKMHTFEDTVIFVLDVERALARLHHREQRVITKVVLQGHSHDSAAREFGCSRVTLTRQLCDALDTLSQLMLERGLLRKM